MTKLIDQAFLLCFIFLLLWRQDNFMLPVILLLSALAFISIYSYLPSRNAKNIFCIALLFTTFFYPPLFLLCPLAFYGLIPDKKCCFLLPYLFLWYAIVFESSFFTSLEFCMICLLCILALYLNYQTTYRITLEQECKKVRDEATEANLILDAKNKEIMKNQNDEVHLATLSERNRIAREIHDNVGHMLSRTILQIGALMVVYKGQPVCQQLESIHGTLDQAMTSIRESVHDLHDDAVDLKMSIRESIKDIDTKFQVSVDYDITSDLPREIKYCMISVIKEALSNAVKHSNGNQIKITVREHPGFYQLSIADNGTQREKDSEDFEALMNRSGIGLSNMKQRVEALSGTFRIHQNKGFQIFVSIPR